MSEQHNDPQYASDLHRQGEVETAVKPRRRSRKWIGRLIGFMFVGTLVGAAIIGVMKFVNDPVSGAITASELKKSISPTPVPPGRLGGIYVTMLYPSVFNQVAQLKTDGSALEQYRVSSSQSYRRTVTVEVKPLTSRLSEDSSYRLRQLQPENYTPSTKTVNGEAVTIMTKSDNSEVTFFWYHAGRLLTVAVTTTEPGEHPADFADLMMASVKWL
jgi:hypothetical protein